MQIKRRKRNMNKINWKVRFKNPVFIAQLILAILMPILAYAGLTVQDMTTWQAVGDLLLGAISNPYVIGLVIVSVWNALNDPTTTGITDSSKALTYDVPNSNK
jgi:phi LC3 family holin